MADQKRILILGGGYAGVWAGKILEKRFRKRDDVKITLIDKLPFHTLMTELHEVAGWRTEPESVQVPFRKIFATKKIDVVLDTITGVELEKKVVRTARGEYAYDYLVVGFGAQPEFFGIPGVKENSFSLWSFDDAMKLRNHVEDVWTRAAAEPDPDKRRRLLTFVVAGAGFTGIEMFGELVEHRDVMCRKHHIDRSEVRIVNVEALPSILPILEEPLRAATEKYLAKHGAEMMLNTPIVGAEPGKVLLKDKGAIETETFIWTCGVSGSSFAAGLGLAKAERGRGRLQADSGMGAVGHPGVYVAGDNAFLLEDGKPVPQIVEAAHQTAEVAAANIIEEIEGTGKRHEFKSNFHGFMVSIGGRYAVANAGGMKSKGFIAMAMKHMINCWYLLNIAGVNQVWEYVKHEFLDMKNGRSFIGSFASYKVRGYWPLLLRMWLGLMWVFEGVNKIGEGWLAWGSGSKSGWMFSQGVVQAGQKAAEATSAASAEWVEGAEAAVEATAAASGAWVEPAAEAVAAASEWVAEGAEAVAEGATQAFGKVWDLTQAIIPYDSGFVTWFRQTFMDGIFAFLPFQAFQLMIVAMEIGIGLALFGGLFTWVAAVASIGMCFIFTFSGMFAWDQLWFVFAGILMMGGAGRAFGFDVWVVPFLKRWWNGTKFARKWHFYGDDPSK